jgi:hypothetical protein
MAFGSIREVQAICLVLENEALAKQVDQLAACSFKLLQALK